MPSKTRRLSPEQQEWHAHLVSNGVVRLTATSSFQMWRAMRVLVAAGLATETSHGFQHSTFRPVNPAAEGGARW